MNQAVEKQLKQLEGFEKKLFSQAKELTKYDIFHLDILTNTVIDRSVKLIFAFTTLIRDENFIGAVHLVRCHLDNLLRYSGAWLVESSEDYANEILKGTQVDTLVDKKGNKLKDWYLRNKLNEEYPWITSVYKETSGFVHLSRKHIFSSSRLKDKDEGTIEFRISRKDNYIEDENRLEAIECMQEITRIITNYVHNWIITKEYRKKLSLTKAKMQILPSKPLCDIVANRQQQL